MAAQPLARAWRRAAAAATLLAALLVAAPGTAQAGRSCEAQRLTPQTIEQGLAMAEKTRQALEASGEQVVLLARSGQDLGKYGLRYSHLGFAYRDTDTAGAVRWRVVHKLNGCGSAEADIYRQGLGEFFLDDPWKYEAAWVALQPELQQRVLPLLRDDTRVLQLHVRAYSMVAYPWAQRYQQSNQWALETLAMALEPGAGTRDRAQAWLQFKAYQPTTLRLGALARLGARITAANVAFDDHPNEKRFADRIETVTVDSVFDWLQRSGLGKPLVELRL